MKNRACAAKILFGKNALIEQPSVPRYQLPSELGLLKTVSLVCFVYLTPFSLPENGWLGISSGLTLEGDGPAHPNHLVPWSHHKCWRHWRTVMTMVKYMSYYIIMVIYDITVTSVLGDLKARGESFVATGYCSHSNEV